MLFSISLLVLNLVLISSTRIFYVTRQLRSLSLCEADFENGTIRNETTIVTGFTDGDEIYLAADADEGLLFYSLQGQIHAASIETRATREITSLQPFLDERLTTMAFDSENHLLYIGIANDGADASARIEVCSTRNTESLKECAILLHEHLDPPHYLILDHSDGFMYWINSVRNQIERAFMNGAHHDRHPFQDPVSLLTSSMSPLTALTLHQASNSLYYIRTSQSQSEIWQCILSKRDSCSMVAKKEQILHFSIIQNFFFWSTFSGQMAFCRIDSCESSRFLKNQPRDFDPPELFVPFDKAKNISTDNPCKVMNGGCSDYCLSIKFGRSCACERGVLLLNDQNTCDPKGPNQVIFLATSNGLFMIPVDTNASIPIYLHNKTDPIAVKVEEIDWDPLRKQVVWLDRATKMIHRNFLNATIQQIVSNGDEEAEPTIVRVDPFTGHLILMEKSLGTIKMYDTAKNLSRNVVVGLEKPSGMAYDHVKSMIFYVANHLDERRIFSIFVDGSKPTILADVDKNVNAIDFDSKDRKLYWIQARKLQILEEDGSNLRSIKLPESPGNVNSISKLNKTIFISNNLGRRILAFFLEDSEITKFSEINHGIYGLVKIRSVSLHANLSTRSLCSSNNGGCSHFCVTRNSTSFECLCATFYELKEDNRNCYKMDSSLLAASQDNLFTLSSGAFTELPIKRPIGDIVDIAIDHNNKMIILASENGSLGEISTISFDGTKAGIIVAHSSLKAINSVAIDSRTKNIYWTTKNRLEMVDWKGRFRKTLLWNEIEPMKLRIDQSSGSLFLLAINPETIWKISIDGLEKSRILNFSTPVSTFEISDGKVYWQERNSDESKLKSSDLNGKQIQEIDVALPITEAFLPINSNFFWIDESRTSIHSSERKKFELNRISEKINALAKIDHKTLDLKIHSNICEELKCDQLCVGNDDGGKCLCSDHYEMDEMDVCKAIDSFVYVGSSEGLQRIAAANFMEKSKSTNPQPHISTKFGKIGTPELLSFDRIGSNTYLFWTDSKIPGAILVAIDFYDDQIQQISLNRWNCSNILSMSVDSLGKQLFVLCDDHFGALNQTAIEIFKIEEHQNMIQIDFIGSVFSSATNWRRKDPQHATGIAIFPLLGLLFYVDIGNFNHPKIFECHFDGKNCRVWLNEGLRWDTKIFADPDHQRLFYTSPSGVWSRDVSAPNLNIKHHYIRQSDVSRLSVAALTEELVFIAEDHRLIVTDSKMEYSDLGAITSLLFLPRSKKINSIKPCSKMDCPFICSFDRNSAISNSNFKCLCPMKYTTGRYGVSGVACEPEIECLPWQFLCGDGKSCVHRATRCDFVRDCPDNSDEDPTFCEVVGVDRWPCEDGHGNIMRTSICDGKQDCKDNSDESHCRCGTNELDCLAWPGSQDTRCVHRQRLCDGIDDCESRLDENSLMCSNLSSINPPQTTPEWLYLALFACLCLPLTVLFCWCCVRQKPLITTVVEQPIYHYNTGATTSILLPPESRGRHVELALRTYSVVESSSSGQPLPTPNRHNGSNISSNHGRAGQSMLFYAPPPSAASLSTYGVVKPTSMRLVVDSGTQRRRLRSRDHSREPPPGYYESGSNLIQTSEPIVVDFPSPAHRYIGDPLLTPRRTTPYRNTESSNSGSQPNRKGNRRKRPFLVPSNSRFESSEGEADKSSQESSDSS